MNKIAWVVVVVGGWAAHATAGGQTSAADILRATGVKGGLIVHLGCGGGERTVELRAGEAFTVQGLAATAQQVAAARALAESRGLYGPVSIDRQAGTRLPYADNLVNLLVAEDALGVPQEEMLRVLAPGGTAYVKQGASWRRTVKPQPADIDEWGHYLHDAGNNAVAKDTVVGPPRRLQWVAPPLWLRSHETASGVQAQVAAGGRLFYIFDEGPIGIVDERLPDRWSLICRDAFNGKLLWKRPMPNWGWREWNRSRFEGKDWTVLRAARTTGPAELQRRLVADGARLYATLGYRAALSVLDPASGELLATVEGTEPTQEILASGDVAVAHVRQDPAVSPRGGSQPAVSSVLVAAEGTTGKVLWRKDAGATIRPLCLALAGGKVLYLAGKTLAALDCKTGQGLWQTQARFPDVRNLVAADGVVLMLGAKTLACHDGATGKLLWQETVPPRSGGEGPDLFVVDGLAWPGLIPLDAKGNPSGKSDRAMALGFDIRTGERKRRIVVDNFRSPEHHHRCYRNKATSRYIITGMEGAEFLDLRGEAHGQNNWLRGACKEGIMPCYGLLYAPADQCFCQLGGKLVGYTAVAPAPSAPQPDVPDEQRLEKGPAYGSVDDRPPDAGDRGDWPTYRADAARHGSTTDAVGATVARAWRVRPGPDAAPGRLSQPVVAGARLLVAAIDAHTVHALDLATGKGLWRFIAGGRIDSPPTVSGGRVLFGSADGYVYCLRLTDGELAWRFLAAPHDRRIASFDQIESAWPVHGSVLLRDGVAYVAAGRSTYLDEGIAFWGLNPATGAIRHKGRLAGPHRRIDGPRDLAFFVPGANSDVLVAEGDSIYMRQKKLTGDLKEIDPHVLSNKGEKDVGLHVFSTAGLLDGSWYNRTFWMYSKRWPGFQLANQAPKAGQLLVVDANTTYAVRVFYRRNVHSPMFFPGREGYLLFADRNTNEPQIVGEPGARPPLAWLPQSDYSLGRVDQVRKLDSPAFGLDKMIGYTRAEPPLWTRWVSVRPRAMVKTRHVLFAAGPPDELDGADPLAALEGRKGAVLLALSPNDGNQLARLDLDSPPVFDGMIAARGRLLLSLEDGSILCLISSAE